MTPRVLVLVAAFFAVVSVSAANAAANRQQPNTLRSYADAKAQAAAQGWSCVAVKADRPGNGFAYSIGLSSKHLPELGVFATDDVANACSAIDRVAKDFITAGRAPRSGAEVFRNGEGRVVLRAVVRNQFFTLCTFAKRWRDEHHIAGARAMQLVVLGPNEAMPR
ncbi:MAG: DUF4262 domain-containing protein [Candidatus Eremiobacteraeota bacterium]|nr:DUF4262 domain-containing protein [Candidatus Eremiobacteraeota bacterium]